MKPILAITLAFAFAAELRAQEVLITDQSPPPVFQVDLSPTTAGDAMAHVLPLLATTNSQFRVRQFEVVVQRAESGILTGGEVTIRAQISADALRTIRQTVASPWSFPTNLREQPVAGVTGFLTNRYGAASVLIRFQ